MWLSERMNYAKLKLLKEVNYVTENKAIEEKKYFCRGN